MDSVSAGGDDFVLEDGTISGYVVGIMRNIYSRLV